MLYIPCRRSLDRIHTESIKKIVFFFRFNIFCIFAIDLEDIKDDDETATNT